MPLWTRRVSNCGVCQAAAAPFSARFRQGFWPRRTALAMMTSFRASAMRITLGALPAFSKSARRTPRVTALPWRAARSTQVQHPDAPPRRPPGDESLPVPTTTVPDIHRCHAHQPCRHLLAGQRAQLRQVRQQRPASSPDRSPESTATTRPWPSTPDSASIAWAQLPVRLPDLLLQNAAGSPRCSDAPSRPAVVSRFDSIVPHLDCGWLRRATSRL